MLQDGIDKLAGKVKDKTIEVKEANKIRAILRDKDKDKHKLAGGKKILVMLLSSKSKSTAGKTLSVISIKILKPSSPTNPGRLSSAISPWTIPPQH